MTDAVVARLDGVSHRYGATVALADVTIEVPARKMVGVIGPDGVGKSTMLALISGVRTVQSGKVIVFDGDVTDGSHLKGLRARVAYMPQGLGRNLYPTLSVFENIDFFGRLFGQSATERRLKITELLTATALDPFEARPAGKLSGRLQSPHRNEPQHPAEKRAAQKRGGQPNGKRGGHMEDRIVPGGSLQQQAG